MKPLRVWAENYGPYQHVEWTVPEGVTAILGRNDSGEGISSNGAGKTKLLELLPIALFGPRLSWSDYVTLGEDGVVCEVGCEFERAGRRYRVRRRFEAKGRGKTTTDFEQAVPDYTVDDLRAGIELARGGVEPGPYNDRWETLTRDRQDATQEAIDEVLGVSAATFGHSVYSAQGAPHLADSALTPAQRKALLFEVLKLDVWERRQDAVRSELRAIDSELTSTRARLGDWEEQLAGRDTAAAALQETRDAAARLEAELAAAQEAHDSLQSSYEAARAQRRELTETSGLVEAQERELAALRVVSADGEAAAGELGELQPLLEAARALAATVAERQRQVDEIRDAESKRRDAENERARLLEQGQGERREAIRLEQQAAAFEARAAETDDRADRSSANGPGQNTCDRCEQVLGEQALERAVASWRADAQKLRGEAEASLAEAKTHTEAAAALVQQADAVVIPPLAPDGAFAEADRLLSEARVAEVTVGSLEALEAGCKRRIDAASTVEFLQRVADATSTRDTLVARQAELLRDAPPEELAMALGRDALGAKVELERLQVELGNARSQLGAREQRVQQLDELAAKATEVLERIDVLNARATVLDVLQRAYGRDGVPALVMESQAIPELEREADRVLEALGVPYRVEWRTQAENRTNDRVRDTLDLVVHEPRGERAYATFSGGERARVNVAIRFALARLLAHGTGAPMEVFALDEVEHLDAAGTARLAELLKDLQQEIPVVLFISHDPSMVDLFDQTVTVVREGGRSRLETAA